MQLRVLRGYGGGGWRRRRDARGPRRGQAAPAARCRSPRPLAGRLAWRGPARPLTPPLRGGRSERTGTPDTFSCSALVCFPPASRVFPLRVVRVSLRRARAARLVRRWRRRCFRPPPRPRQGRLQRGGGAAAPGALRCAPPRCCGCGRTRSPSCPGRRLRRNCCFASTSPARWRCDPALRLSASVAAAGAGSELDVRTSRLALPPLSRRSARRPHATPALTRVRIRPPHSLPRSSRAPCGATSS